MSFPLRVTRTRSCTIAVAASRPPTVETGRRAAIRPQVSATGRSTGRPSIIVSPASGGPGQPEQRGRAGEVPAADARGLAKLLQIAEPAPPGADGHDQARLRRPDRGERLQILRARG